MYHEKILDAITSSISHLKDSVKAFAKKDETKVMDNVWQAAADIEYALLLFSLSSQDDTNRSSWKLDPRPKQAEIEPLLVSAKDLLKTATESIRTKNCVEAHKKAWVARGHLLKIHEAFEKKRRSGEKPFH